ncbi:hypothetical protein [Methylocystis suflitae]|uniref:hypothetical protein n=1 Tax=Methylocystis suflitae TaxID=2951405 RepID=UPI0021086492|nr:hypothetical protein [Methylocystis suflitae]MCQ4190747.1 hypothetical protein [Methylocystis suflitae]
MADETFLLGEAISRHEKPENRSKREAAVHDHFNLLTAQTAAKPVNEEIVVWQEKITAAVQRRKECEAQTPTGLLEALKQRDGHVSATGHIGGLHNPKITIPADVWRKGAWEFQPRANFARGGDPLIEIYGLRIVEAAQGTAESRSTVIVEVVERDALPLLAKAREPDVQTFLNGLTPCAESAARDAAEAHFRVRIPNFRKRFNWPRRDPGRPRLAK